MPAPVHPGLFKSAGLLEKETAAMKKVVQGWSRSRKTAVFAQGPQRVREALKKFPRRMWRFTAQRGNWTITQVLWHLADQEANLYVRLRRAAAEPGQLVSPYDQNKWADRLLYSQADPEQARDLILLLRQANADLLKRISPKAWKGKVNHPEWGLMSLEFLVGLNIWHLEHHLVQMRRRFLEWKRAA
jgi:hypothetical protein